MVVVRGRAGLGRRRETPHQSVAIAAVTAVRGPLLRRLQQDLLRGSLPRPRDLHLRGRTLPGRIVTPQGWQEQTLPAGTVDGLRGARRRAGHPLFLRGEFVLATLGAVQCALVAFGLGDAGHVCAKGFPGEDLVAVDAAEVPAVAAGRAVASWPPTWSRILPRPCRFWRLRSRSGKGSRRRGRRASVDGQ